MSAGAPKTKKPRKKLARLSYSGSPTWTRTRDLRINSPSLYRLSYQGSIEGAIMNDFFQIYQSVKRKFFTSFCIVAA